MDEAEFARRFAKVKETADTCTRVVSVHDRCEDRISSILSTAGQVILSASDPLQALAEFDAAWMAVKATVEDLHVAPDDRVVQ